MRWVWLAVLIAIVPCAADAGSWVQCAGSVDATATQLKRFQSLCYEWTATGDSTLIDVATCSPLDIGPLTPSTTDTATGATAYAYRCTQGTPGSAAPAAGCSKMLVDTDGDGVPDDVTLDGVTLGRVGQQYQTATLLYVSPQAATSGKTARLMISCH